jgi:hypothetical protein
MDIIGKKYICECCKYYCNTPSDWLKHLGSKKHMRKGEQINHKCTLCDYETSSMWNYKLHQLSQHSTKEERAKSKYYCELCDQVFFSPLYMDKHMKGIRHKNIMLVQKYSNNI